MDLVNQRILVLSIDHYEVTDDTTGRVSSGVSCWYYANPKLEPIENSKDSRGMKPAKMSLPENFLNVNRDLVVPCIGTVDFVMRPDSKGKMQLTPTNFSPVAGSLRNPFVDPAASDSADTAKKAAAVK